MSPSRRCTSTSLAVSLVRTALLLLWLLPWLAGCRLGAPAPTAEPGILAGQVTIGPLSPVEQAGQSPTPPPEVFAAREIVIYDESGKKEVARAGIGPDGQYRLALPPGDYVVDINHAGIDSAAGLPQKVTILSGVATRLDIDIDTGIR